MVRIQRGEDICKNIGWNNRIRKGTSKSNLNDLSDAMPKAFSDPC